MFPFTRTNHCLQAAHALPAIAMHWSAVQGCTRLYMAMNEGQGQTEPWPLPMFGPLPMARLPAAESLRPGLLRCSGPTPFGVSPRGPHPAVESWGRPAARSLVPRAHPLHPHPCWRLWPPPCAPPPPRTPPCSCPLADALCLPLAHHRKHSTVQSSMKSYTTYISIQCRKPQRRFFFQSP